MEDKKIYETDLKGMHAWEMTGCMKTGGET